MYGSQSFVHKRVWALRRALRLSPMQRLFNELSQRGIVLRNLDALELFGADGSRHTIDYCRLVRSLEIWELNEVYLPSLNQNLPKARIKITDTFKEIQTTSNTYNLLVSDETGQLYGQNKEHCEHFDLMTKHLFRVARPKSVIVVNVVPEPLRQLRAANVYPEFSEYLERRRAFYRSDHPERIPIEEMIPAYRRTANANGFNLDWHVNIRRTIRSGVSYLALAVSRR
jgi:hypothetical protein